MLFKQIIVLYPENIVKPINIKCKFIVRFQVLTVTSMKTRAFWDIESYTLVEVDLYFRGAYSFHHHGSTHLYFHETTRLCILESCHLHVELLFVKGGGTYVIIIVIKRLIQF
jgi:hypothetical protein